MHHCNGIYFLVSSFGSCWVRSVGDFDGCMRVGGLAGGWMVESTVPGLSAACRSSNVIVYAVRVLRALGGGELRTAWTWAGTPWRTPIYDPRGGPQPLSRGRIRVENVGSGFQVRREHPNPLI